MRIEGKLVDTTEPNIEDLVIHEDDLTGRGLIIGRVISKDENRKRVVILADQSWGVSAESVPISKTRVLLPGSMGSK